MAIVGGGGQAELAIGARAPAHAGAGRPRLARGRRRARGLHHRPRRAVHPGGPEGGRAAARPRRGRRRGDGRRAARRARPARASRRPCATPTCATDVEALGAERAIDPEGFEEHGPFDVVLELVGAPNMPGNLKALDTGGRIVVIGVGAGFKAEVNLLALMGKRATLRASTLRARPLEEKAQTARLVEQHVLAAAGERRGAASPSPPRSRSTRPRPPTSASPPAASSARSCCCRERRRGKRAAAEQAALLVEDGMRARPRHRLDGQPPPARARGARA